MWHRIVHLKRQYGFTLIELIVALVLTALLTVIFSMGLNAALQTYAFSRANIQVSQKIQPAIARMTREIMELTNIIAVSGVNDDPFIIYERVYQESSGERTARFGLHYHQENQNILLYTDLDDDIDNLDHITATDGDLLIDEVGDFSLAFFKEQKQWRWEDGLRLLSSIQINIHLIRPDHPKNTQNFSTIVHLRNTANFGGAVLTENQPGANTYCFIHASLDQANPLLLLIYMGGLAVASMLILHTLGKKRWLHRDRYLNNNGSVLIAIIVAILVFSTLIATLLPMISSSDHQLAGMDLSTKAYYIAESGFRYAASRYLHMSDNQKNSVLENLDRTTCVLNDNQGQFNILIYSFFYTLTADVNNLDTFAAHTPGTLPSDEIDFSGNLKLRIQDQTYTVQQMTPKDGEDDIVIIKTDTALNFFPKDTVILPVAHTVGSQQISNGEELIYQPNDGGLFPLRNGRIQVNGHTLDYRWNDRTNHRFTHVRDSNGDMLIDLPVNSGTEIVLTPYVRAHLIGIYGSTTRQVTYYTPLPPDEFTTERQEFRDSFEGDTIDNWDEGLGTLSNPTEGDMGGKVLKVDTTKFFADDFKASLAVLDTQAAQLKFNKIHRHTQGFLSYDVQVKTGFVNTLPEPVHGYYPEAPVPAYFASGLMFRLREVADEIYNGYGISFLRGNTGITDGIPDEIVPKNDQRAIVLWQQTNNGEDRQWLAYKTIPVTFSLPKTDFELDTGGWSTDAGSLWHRTSSKGHNSTTSWYYGQENLYNYDTGDVNSGILASQPITLCADYPQIHLKFYSWHATETQNPDQRDIKQVLIRVWQESNWTDPIILHTISGSSSASQWLPVNVDLTPYAGQQICIQFLFDTVDAANNDYLGWYIDDVSIECQWPVQNATLLVRLKEAAIVQFHAGGLDAIRTGDQVYGQSSKAKGTVICAPILSSGSWADKDAVGYLLLNKKRGAFTSDERLFVIGKSDLATVTSDEDKDGKVNVIRVFYGTESGSGAATGDPLDNNFNPYPRLGKNDELKWPPDSDIPWTNQNDCFRLIQWDEVNTGQAVILASQNEPDAIIRTQHDDLQSPDFGNVLSHLELGLHAYSQAASHTYFDDFGLQFDFPQTILVPTPLQQ